MANDLTTKEIEIGIKGLLFGKDSDSFQNSDRGSQNGNDSAKQTNRKKQKPGKRDRAKKQAERLKIENLESGQTNVAEEGHDQRTQKGSMEAVKNEKARSTKEAGASARNRKKSSEINAKDVGMQNLLLQCDVEEIVDKEVKQLENDCIFPLKKKSDKFPRAKYFCRMCEYHCDDIQHCTRHIKDNRHQRLRELRDADTLLKNLPPLTANHVLAIDELISGLYEDVALSADNLEKRCNVVDRVQAVIESKLPVVTLVPYGSTVTGFGLKSSDLNLDIMYPSGQSPAKVLIASLEALQSSDIFTSVQSDFSAKIPSITAVLDGIQCQLGVDNRMACETSALLGAYSKIDPRVRQLGVVFRHWAKLCKIDDQVEGTLPAYAFALMTVYFLQQVQPPVLPCLHDIPRTSSEKTGDKVPPYFSDLDNLSAVWETSNKQSVGRLWIDLLKFYSVDFDMSDVVVCIRQGDLMMKKDKKWGSKRLAIEDPFSTKRNLTRSVSHGELFEYIYDRIRAAHKYFGIPQTNDGPLLANATRSFNDLGSNQRKPDHPAPESKEVVPDFLVKRDTKLEQKSTNQNIPEQDLDSEINQQIACSSGASDIDLEAMIDNYVMDVVRSASEDREEDVDEILLDEQKDDQHLTQSDGSEDALEDIVDGDLGTDEKTVESAKRKSNEIVDFADQLDKLGRVVLYDSKGNVADLKKMTGLDRTDFVFKLPSEALLAKEGPPIVCKICLKKGHLKQNCPEERLPKMIPLPKLNKAYDSLLTDVLLDIPEDYAPTPEEVRSRRDIVRNLEKYLREIYPETKLTLFGSSCNGFGFRQSDLDICMTLDNPTSEGLDCVAIIEKLAAKMKRHRDFTQVLPITTAKVPILKFRHIRSRARLEGDISLYNTLAQHNTRMLQAYAEIDDRVRVLGYVMKVFAKICDIGDASRGSLSSYAYVLMVIYYLQQCKPPVIPVLQEMYDPTQGKPEIVVDNCNVWFYKDTSNLRKVWKDYGKNKQSVAQLWVGLLRFYTEKFDIKSHVVCIRQHDLLTRFEKMWNGKCIAIEDPFELSHNLGAGLSRKMQGFIMKAFINGRNLHGIPVTPNDIYMDYKHFFEYFFDSELLNDGEYAPNDRGCRVCGKIGHIAKECHIVQQRKERDQKAKERKQRQNLNQNQRHNAQGPRPGQYPNNQRNRNGPQPIQGRTFHNTSEPVPLFNSPPRHMRSEPVPLFNSPPHHVRPEPVQLYNSPPRNMQADPRNMQGIRLMSTPPRQIAQNAQQARFYSPQHGNRYQHSPQQHGSYGSSPQGHGNYGNSPHGNRYHDQGNQRYDQSPQGQRQGRRHPDNQGEYDYYQQGSPSQRSQGQKSHGGNSYSGGQGGRNNRR